MTIRLSTEQAMEELKALILLKDKDSNEYKRIHALRVLLTRRGVKAPTRKAILEEENSKCRYDFFIDTDGSGFYLLHANLKKSQVMKFISIYKQMKIPYKLKESL